jgi:hypothetical protein
VKRIVRIRRHGRRNRLKRSALVVASSLTLAAAASATIGHDRVAANPLCINSLTGSNFEVDPNANLVVNNSGANCVDWLTGGTGTALRAGVVTKTDKPAGPNDDSFGQGTKEDDANPTIVDGSIPPNKSDLKVFGVFTETTGAGKFLELFWTRINSPQGTVNMDFELNQKFCDLSATPTNCADNGKKFPAETPLRTAGDKLITYDLDQGGTVPTISIRTWSGSAWGSATVISGTGGLAIGSINTSLITANNADGIGPLDPLTFGEAAINFSALFPPGAACGAFGSAYLKSRSATSFSAELKDFIGPQRVNITNCTGLVTNATASVTIGDPISDTATLSGATTDASGTITFHLFSNATCTAEVTTGLTPVTVNGNGNYNSGNFTPTAVGTYFWTANYSGDAKNEAASTACGDANESSVVNKAPSNIATVQRVFPQDSATVSASAGGTPTGSVSFSLYGPSDTTCSGVAVYSETNVPLTGGAAGTTNTTFSVIASTSGTYRWVVSYGGDATHDPSSSACTENVTVTIVN